MSGISDSFCLATAGGCFEPPGFLSVNLPRVNVQGSGNVIGIASLCPFSHLWQKRRLDGRQVGSTASADAMGTMVATATAFASETDFATSIRLLITTNGAGNHWNGDKSLVPNMRLLATCMSLLLGFGIVAVELLQSRQSARQILALGQEYLQDRHGFWDINTAGENSSQ